MACAGYQEGESAVAASTSSSSLFALADNIWADSKFPHSSLADNNLCIITNTSCQSFEELSNSEVHALPTSHQAMVESDSIEAHALSSARWGMAEFNSPEAHALPPSSSGLDQTAVAHLMNPFSMQLVCSPPLRNPGPHAKMHVPSLHSSSTMEGSSNAVVHASCWSSSDVNFSSGSDVEHSTAPLMSEASPARFQFMQSFVNTLLPELKRIHSQSPPISFKEKLPAVRLAADMSLAISARGNNTWSQALFRELLNSSSRKVGVRRKNYVRKSNILRGRIYTSILRRSSRRRGPHALRLQSRSQASHSKGSDSFACFSVFSDCPPSALGLSAKCSHANSNLSACLSGDSSDTVHCKTISYIRRMRRARLKRQSGLFSYVKILRNSRPSKNFASVKSPTDLCNEPSKAYTPSISKEHIVSLGRLVPGGRDMDVPLLFQEAADYIVSLQMQVQALQSLSHFVSL